MLSARVFIRGDADAGMKNGANREFIECPEMIIEKLYWAFVPDPLELDIHPTSPIFGL